MRKRISLSHLIAMLFAALLLFCMGNTQGNPVYGPSPGKEYALSNSPPAVQPAMSVMEPVSLSVQWISRSTPGSVFDGSAMDNQIVNPADVPSTACYSLSSYAKNRFVELLKEADRAFESAHKEESNKLKGLSTNELNSIMPRSSISAYRLPRDGLWQR